MNHNPKVVSFDRSAAYLHHRAMKNMRENNPVDALELMRHAVESSPENREYRLDLAEMYCEMGCYEQSNRILLDMIAEKDAPAECYYGLALNQFGRNEMESARQALLLYAGHAGMGEYAEEAGGLMAEMDFTDAARRPMNRKNGRAVMIAGRACDALKADDPEKACRLFQKSFELHPGTAEMHSLYALALRMRGDEESALAVARSCAEDGEACVRALCVAAQVFWMCGLREQAQNLARRAIEMKPGGVDLRLMIFALGEMEMHTEAADALRRALWEAPHDKNLLHMRAVALHRAGCADERLESFWQRILRIDPEDSIAAFYCEAAAQNKLSENEPGYVYEVPGAEYRRRLICIADCLGEGLEQAVERWKNDAQFRKIVLWAAGSGDENCGRAAVMIIASAGDEASESALRELLYRGDIPLEVKLHALLFLRLRGADVGRFMPPGMNVHDGLLPQPEVLLKQMPACERQLVRYAGEIMEYEYGVRAPAALALMWQTYREACRQDNDPLVCTQEAAAALAWNYLLGHGVKVDMKKLAWLFGCRERRMVFYARRMAAVLEMYGGSPENEDH